MNEDTASTTSENSASSYVQDYYNLIKAEHEANNAWSAEQAQKAMDYQTEMSNTAHQREIADLKAAGLNPVLSAGGTGATTGSGLAAQRSDENVQALYGLTKQALDATMSVAKSMANSAKYYSGSAGYSNANGSVSDLENTLQDAGSGILYRMLGVPKDAGKELLNYAFAGLKLWGNIFGLPESVTGVQHTSEWTENPRGITAKKDLASWNSIAKQTAKQNSVNNSKAFTQLFPAQSAALGKALGNAISNVLSKAKKK